ncbi:DUF5677 domain-containing protein [Pseudomonas sp. LMG 31766]|uniref:Uncharacterized protein n=1 Tax=Pseudomonas chaetocerotis TaxID=2758695 RepID=A0A931D0M3_9PSED|nr:DUF5677 domain-containing protein [Pseudomonas chaetocerotis]MBZ9666957.1 DUF5677 domain-containing protein [Pseudomonas chaetocerotis]
MDKILVESESFISPELDVVLSARSVVSDVLQKAARDLLLRAREISGELNVPCNQVSDVEKQRLTALVLYVRLLDVSESIYILSMLGARQEVKALFRVFLDAYFLVANAINDQSFFLRYFQVDSVERLKLLKVARHELPKELFDETVVGLFSDESLNDLRSEIDEGRLQAFNSYENAKGVGCQNIYNLRYRIYSASVHTGPRAFVEYLSEEDQGDVVRAVSNRISFLDADRIVFDTGFYVSNVIAGLAELFDYPLSAEFSASIEEFKRLEPGA